jgi:hypothetical protein
MIPNRPTIIAAQPTVVRQPGLDSEPQSARVWPQPTLAPPQPSGGAQPPVMAMAQMPGPAMRYPQPAPVALNNGAIPPTPDRLNELPAVGDGIRPLPPVQ